MILIFGGFLTPTSGVGVVPYGTRYQYRTSGSVGGASQVEKVAVELTPWSSSILIVDALPGREYPVRAQTFDVYCSVIGRAFLRTRRHDMDERGHSTALYLG